MRIIEKASLALSLLLTAPIAAASGLEESGYGPVYDACMAAGDAAKGVTSAILDCTHAEIDKRDALLNLTFRQVMARSSPARRQALRASERTWIAKRDRRCENEIGEESGGTLGAVIFTDCILSETIKRTAWLDRYG